MRLKTGVLLGLLFMAALAIAGCEITVKYVVTFNSQGGSAVSSQQVEEGGRVIEPSDPVKGTMVFAGWYKESGYITRWDFESDYVYDDITLYAKWRSYLVTFDSQGGNAVEPQPLNGGDKIIEPEDMEYGNLIFGGWFKEPGCVTRWDFDSEVVTSSITLFAKWLPADAMGFEVYDTYSGSLKLISSNGDRIGSDVFIPAYFQGNKIVSVGPLAFNDQTELTTVLISSKLEFLFSETFDGCLSLERISVRQGSTSFSSVNGVLFNKDQTWLYLYPQGKTATSYTIPSTVTSLMSYCFRQAAALEHVSIPSSMKSISREAFANCTALTDITLPSSILDVSYYAFENCTALRSVTIEPAAAAIHSGAFSGCIALETITIPSTVTLLEGETFKDCTSLTTAVINAPVDGIGYATFEGCLSLTSVTLPSTVTSIGPNVFMNCASLKGLTLPSDLTAIQYNAFNGCESLKSMVLPSGVTLIGNSAFAGCPALETINIPSGVTQIGISAFEGCTALTGISIPSATLTIGEKAFMGCESLNSVTLATGVDTIEPWAFAGCLSLTSITLPSTLRVFGNSATDMSYIFDNCPALAAVNVAPSCYGYRSDNGVFYKVDNRYLPPRQILLLYPPAKTGSSYTIPDDVYIIGRPGFHGNKTLESLHANTANTFIASLDGVLFNKALTSLLCYPEGKPGVSYAVPAGVSSIDSYAFNGCNKLERVTIPSSVNVLSAPHFFGCTALTDIDIDPANTGIQSIDGVVFNPGLHSVEIYPVGRTAESYDVPDGIVGIDSYAFQDCPYIRTVHLPSTLAWISGYAFKGCTSLESINIPSGVWLISSQAFYNCSTLENIFIPVSVETMNKDVFTGCTSLSICCEAESQPVDWQNGWDGGRPVTWNCTP